MEKQWLIYGANGYTGQLIAERAVALGMRPILAGRNEDKLRPLAERLGLAYRAFDLAKAETLDEQLEGMSLVLHAAGPFLHTARPMMEACIRNRTHYIDITGEIPVFELAASLGPKAAKAGIMLMPGTGFDVVPTDCMACYLKEQLPDAKHLQLAFASRNSRLSQGTATTMAENLGQGGAVRRRGKITRVPLGHSSMTVPFAADYERFAMAIPWGDVSTAYYTTGIPNVETYTAVHPKTHRYLKWQKYYNWLLRLPFVRNMAKRRAKQGPAGPSAEEREKGRSYVWGKVENEQQETRSARLSVPEGYQLTAITSLMIAQRVLNNELSTGFQTPAGCYGYALIEEVEGSSGFENLDG